MKLSRRVALPLALALVVTVAPALAGPSGGRSHGAPSLGKGPSVGKHHTKKPKDLTPKDEPGEHGNKGGEVRGLDRADEVAGEHGLKGRENARSRRSR